MTMSMMLLRLMKVHPTTRRECYLYQLILVTVGFLSLLAWLQTLVPLACNDLKYSTKTATFQRLLGLRSLDLKLYLADARLVEICANINIDITKFGPLFQQLMTSLYLSAVCSADENSVDIYSLFQRRVCGHFHCSALFWDLPPIFSSPFDIPACSLPRSLLSSSFILLDELGIEF